MTVFKTMVPLSDGLYRMDTIEHEGQFWLVPEWIDTPRKGWSQPARIVCLSLIAHQPLPLGGEVRFVVTNPIPKSVLTGQIQPRLTTQYVVIERPAIERETHSSGPIH